MDIIINLNIDPTSPEGIRVSYLSNCLQQLSNLYSVVDPTVYKTSLNETLGSMANYILSEDIIAANVTFDDAIATIQNHKTTFFNDYGNWFFNQYSPPT